MMKNKFSTKLPVLLASVAVLGAVIAGCGTTSSAPVENSASDRGFQLFRTNCGTCHKLNAAATSGTQGPDLDDAFAAARAVGMDGDTVKGIVRAQVHRPQKVNGDYPGVTMPANIIEGNDLEDVAAYVASVAGVPGAEPPTFPGEGPGAQVYGLNGCGGCHVLAAGESAGTLGPDLDEVLPQMSKAEIKEAIVDPGKTIAKGYPDAMPTNFGSTISPQQLNQLIDFLVTSAAADGKAN